MDNNVYYTSIEVLNQVDIFTDGDTIDWTIADKVKILNWCISWINGTFSFIFPLISNDISENAIIREGFISVRSEYPIPAQLFLMFVLEGLAYKHWIIEQDPQNAIEDGDSNFRLACSNINKSKLISSQYIINQTYRDSYFQKVIPWTEINGQNKN